MTQFNRRQILKLIGAAPAAGALPLMWSRQAAANPSDVPLRLLFIDVGSGVLRGSWEPSVPPGAGSLLRGDEWALRGPHQVYAPFKSRITAFQNLDMRSAKEDPTPGDNAHINGHTHQLTAAFRPDGQGALGGGMSIDQFIATSLNRPAPVTRLTSLEMTTGRANARSASYSGPEESVPFERDADVIYDRLFPAEVGDEAKRRARRAAASSFVRGEYERLLSRLGAEDRTKLAQMRDLRSDLEARRSQLSPRIANRPDPALVQPFRELGRDVHDESNYELRIDIMSKLAAAALHTDSTRVLTLKIARPPDERWGYTKGQYGSRDWHDLDHKVSGRNRERDLSDPQAATDLILTMQTQYAQAARGVLEELDALQETDGQSLLDHTLVVITSHIADGSHDITRLPWLVIGDAHGYLRTNQLVRFLREHKNGTKPPQYDEGQWGWLGRPHNDLYATLAGAMGVPVERFGESSVATGVIQEMLA